MDVRKSFLLASLLAVCLVQAFAQVDVSIRFFDKRLYFPESEILLKITVKNDSASPFRFKLAEERRHSLWFDARTMTNRAVETSDSYKRSMAASAPVFYREMAIEPGEEYSFVEDLRDFAGIQAAGMYTVRCDFYPELNRGTGKDLAIRSNTLTVSVRPSAGIAPASESFAADSGEMLKAERISPDEVIYRTLRARQKQQWNEFFLYLDLESLILRNPDKKRIYDRESDDGRRRMLETYRNDLKAAVVDEDIVVLPAEFEILETKYGSTAGVVSVMEYFPYQGFRMKKLYTYELEKRDGIWYMTGYVVQNKGTE